MSATLDTYTAFAAWVTSTKPWWVTDLSRYEGERYRHEETWKAFESFAAGRGSVVAPAEPVAPLASEPMFWVRLCSDGMYEGPIHNAQIEKVRQQSGAWHPLYLAAPPAPAPQPEPVNAPTRDDLIAALEFYAKREHMILSDDSAWDTVSGEPQNWWCDEAGTATIEDGTIAKQTLAGKLNAEQINDMEDGEEFPDDLDAAAEAAQHEPAAVPDEPVFHLRSYGDVTAAELERLTQREPTPTPAPAGVVEAPSPEAAEAMGAKGGPAIDAERIAFEAWMRGHCWALGATWTGTEYRSDAEQGGWPDPQAMATRRLWAAWRDRAALSAPVQAVPLTEAARDVLAERRRQVEVEGWTPEHDDQHGDGSMALAAACYAAADPDGRAEAPPLWPWDPEWWKSGDERRNLVKAGALILAEIERLDRAAHGITGDKQHG